MTRPASEILEDLLAVALRIERLLIRDADNATVDYYVRRLSQPRPVTMPGAPEPPIAPVRPQTTWQTPPAGNTYEHGGWIHRDGFSMVGP